MEEDDLPKVPVTRMRRRLSIENDVGSPVPPSTPTKKRLAVKPQLDNIDELATISSPRGRRRISSVRVSVDAPEEKPVTPARRSTRIKSNTSITCEIAQSFDSPRAKRAARRSSAVGSDTEAAGTPTRTRTRRTRKDSASSIENQDMAAKPTTLLANETISEEAETRKTSANSSISSEAISPNSLRKSPRIAAKRVSRNSLSISGSESNTSFKKSNLQESDSLVATISTKPSQIVFDNASENHSVRENNASVVRTSPKPSNNLNDSRELKKSEELDKILDSSKSKNDSINESMRKTKKPRTSDQTSAAKTSEDVKKGANANRSFNVQKLSNDVGAGDAFVFKAKTDQSPTISDKEYIDICLDTSRRIKRDREKSISSMKSDTSVTSSKKRNNSDKIDGIDTVDTSINTNLESGNLLQQVGSKDIKCTVYIEGSDSITGIIGKTHNAQFGNADDQCVPVVDKVEESNEIESNTCEIEPEKGKSSLFASKTLNCSIEPMDIDETLPENVVIPYSPSAIAANNNSNIDKTLLSRSEKLEKTSNENKSTLILSQLKDDSAFEANNTKSPKKKKFDVSKTTSHSITDNSSKTPLRNKNLQQSGMQTSTPVIPTNKEHRVENNTSKTIAPKDQSKSHNKEKQVSDESESDKGDEEVDAGHDYESDDSQGDLQRRYDDYSKSRNRENQLSDELESDSSGEEISLDKSDLLDDEALDAGDDYESGDSQDDSQRRYVEENAIVELGQTLTSDEDISNDSNYENDSFVVSSDEEDRELLSGSGDDLSLDDNELNMSSKSKQKYNELKIKEQKKASREMYEARHGKKKSPLESSDDEGTLKPNKKNRRQRIESSPLQSGDDSIIKLKKSNRLRLVSTDTAKSDSNASVTIKKSKKKQVFDDSITNEKEITLVGNDSMLGKEDPLKSAVKGEPKSPLKDFNISTVNFNTVMDVEQIHVNDNASILMGDETSDPLQATMTPNDEDYDSSSGNEEIIQNYDSMLSSLSKETKQSPKGMKVSLSSKKRSKQNSDSVLDHFNLTGTKNKESAGKTIEVLGKNTSKNLYDDESTTDSTDLKLIFSGDDASESSDRKRTGVKETCYPGDEDFIPLKRTEGKTNLLENIGKSPNKLACKTPESLKKKKIISESDELHSEVKRNAISDLKHSSGSKKKNISSSESSLIEAAIFEDHTPTSNMKDKTPRNSFTVGDELPMESTSAVRNSKKKKTKTSESSVIADTNEPGKSPDKLAYKTPESLKKKKKISESDEVQSEVKGNARSDLKHSSGSKKKKISSSESSLIEAAIFEDHTPTRDKKNKTLSNSFTVGDELPMESTSAVRNSNKKKKKTSEPSVIEDTNEPGKSPDKLACKTPESLRKIKKISESDEVQSEVKGNARSDLKHSSGSKKKKISSSESPLIEAAIFEYHTPTRDKKDKTLSNSFTIGDELPTESASAVTATNNRTNSNKKKKNTSESSVIADSNEPEIPSLLTPGSAKKSKKLSSSLTNEQIDGSDQTQVGVPGSKKNRKSSETIEGKLNESSVIVTTGNKKKHSEPADTIDNPNSAEIAPSSNKQDPSGTSQESSIDRALAGANASKKRKRNSSVTEEAVLEELLDNPHDLLLTSKRQNKKKRKIVENASDDNYEMEETEIIFKSETTEAKSSKSKKKKYLEKQIEEPVCSPQNKKRKRRSDDEKTKHAKLIEETFLQSVTVPRLPTNILDQLDEKPKSKDTSRKTNIVSTSAFEVVETRPRKNKPSQYLEESIYLNSASPEKKKRKKNVEKPKVLPFVPTASTSTSGFTTSFKVDINPKETAFIAQARDLPNFKNDYLHNKKMKKLGTFQMYKKQRSVKLCKF